MTLALWCIAVAWFLIYVPRVVVAMGQQRLPGGYDNAQPRQQQARLDGAARRALAAHENSFEAFAPFAAAVLVAHVAAPASAWASPLAVTFCVARAGYIGAYIASFPVLRSLLWLVAFLATLGLFLVAAS